MSDYVNNLIYYRYSNQLKNFNPDISNLCKIYPQSPGKHPLKHKVVNNSYVQYKPSKSLPNKPPSRPSNAMTHDSLSKAVKSKQLANANTPKSVLDKSLYGPDVFNTSLKNNFNTQNPHNTS